MTNIVPQEVTYFLPRRSWRVRVLRTQETLDKFVASLKASGAETIQVRAVGSELSRKPTGKLVPCPGEAHRPEVGGMIDNCSLCAPRWGEVEELDPVDLDEARREGLDVRVGDLTPEQYEVANGDCVDGRANIVNVVEVKGYGYVSYYVFRYVAQPRTGT